MQATSDKTASANFTQTGHSINLRGIANNLTNGKTGYAPYYQAGRKDAFRSAEYTAAPAAGTSLIYSNASVTVGTTIQTPTIFYTNKNGQGDAYSPFYYNAWNATYTTYSTATTKEDGLEKVVKTVYDPCPVGYTVPPANTFTAFNTTNCPVDGNGRKYTINGKTLYFPIARRRGNGDAKICYEDGCYWLAISGQAAYGRLMYISTNEVSPAISKSGKGYVRGQGECIRPVREN